MKFTYYGHSCFLIEINGKKLLFDPFITPNPAAAHIDTSTIKADYILISHAHQDHIADAVTLAKQTGATCIANYEIYLWLLAQGLEKVHPMNHGGQFKFGFGTVKMVNAVHSSSFPDGSYGGNPAGFIIKADGFNFYYAGDTALMSDMKYWGRIHDLDLAILPIGDNFTMGPGDAAIAGKRLKTDHVIGVHYDTFPPIVIDHETAKATFKSKDIKLHLLEIGGTKEF
jgi:L-ascorbate metabolism protein UlaG (beta-lactamase superfamily)